MPHRRSTAITAAPTIYPGTTGLGHWRYPVWRRPARRLSRKRPRAPPNNARLVGSGTAAAWGTAVPCVGAKFMMVGEKKPTERTTSGALPRLFAKMIEKPAPLSDLIRSIELGGSRTGGAPKGP